jgi:hypothetical protein
MVASNNGRKMFSSICNMATHIAGTSSRRSSVALQDACPGELVRVPQNACRAR